MKIIIMIIYIFYYIYFIFENIYLIINIYLFKMHVIMYIYLLIKFLLCVIVTPNQIERLYSRFTSLDRGDCGTLSREDFLRIPELAINPLGDRIVNAFFDESGNDRVNFLQFMQVLAHFRPIKKNSPNRLNSRQEKLKCKLIMS